MQIVRVKKGCTMSHRCSGSKLLLAQMHIRLFCAKEIPELVPSTLDTTSLGATFDDSALEGNPAVKQVSHPTDETHSTV